MGVTDDTVYSDLSRVRDEVEACRRALRRHGWYLIDVTNRPIEETAEEAIARVGERLRRGEESRTRQS